MVPFSCQICGSGFVQKSLFTIHQNRCLGIKEHKYNECDYEAVTKEQVKKHKIHKHGDGIVLNCNHCSRKFLNVVI